MSAKIVLERYNVHGGCYSVFTVDFEHVLVNKVIYVFLTNQLVHRFPYKIFKEQLVISSSFFAMPAGSLDNSF